MDEIRVIKRKRVDNKNREGRKKRRKRKIEGKKMK